MTDSRELKSIILFGYLKDSMLEKIADIVIISEYRGGEYIFKEGAAAKNLYAIIRGKVGLEIEKDSNTQVLINTIGEGQTFGFSSLVDTEEKSYTSSAKAMEDTEAFTWEATDLEALFAQDFELGFQFMRRIAKIIKTRLQIRNIQFLDIYR